MTTFTMQTFCNGVALQHMTVLNSLHTESSSLREDDDRRARASDSPSITSALEAEGPVNGGDRVECAEEKFLSFNH